MKQAYRRRLLLSLLLLITTLCLSACGQKGDLYLPDDNEKSQQQ